MQIGDLIVKYKGYGSEQINPMIGLIVGFHIEFNSGYTKKIEKVIVFTEDNCEMWIKKFCKKTSPGNL